MLNLISVLKESRIPRFPLKVSFQEGEGHEILCSTIIENNDSEHMVEIVFKNVAKLNIISLNLYDYIKPSKINFDENSGFFMVSNSDPKNWQKFDPGNRLNLKNYIINGYDSHLNILSSHFDIIKTLSL